MTGLIFATFHDAATSAGSVEYVNANGQGE